MKDVYISLLIFFGACVYMTQAYNAEISNTLHEWAHAVNDEDHDHLHTLRNDQVQLAQHEHKSIQLFNSIFQTKPDSDLNTITIQSSKLTFVGPKKPAFDLDKFCFPSNVKKHTSLYHLYFGQDFTALEGPPPKHS